LSQFLENCPKRWRNRVIEVANIDLNISEQIKVILDTTKHELLINNWRNLEEVEQIAHINKNKDNKKIQKQQNSNDSQKGRSISKIKETMVCFNCFRMGHTKKECRNPTYCQACRDEHIPGSEVCGNAWRYEKIGKDHKKYSNGNYNYGNYNTKNYNNGDFNNYQTQADKDNTYQNDNTNQNYTGYQNQYGNNRGNFRGNFRSYYRGGGTYNQYHNNDYRQNNGGDYRHENNVYKKSYGNHNHISTLNAAPEQQVQDTYEVSQNRDAKSESEIPVWPVYDKEENEDPSRRIHFQGESQWLESESH